MHRFISCLVASLVWSATCHCSFADDLGDCIQEQDTLRAIHGCTSIIEHSTSGDRGMAYFRRANAYYRNKDYDRSLADFTTIIDRLKAANNGECPKFCADIFIRRGNIFLVKMDFRRAIADFDQAIERKSDHAEYFGIRALAYLNSKQYDQSVADYKRAIELDPQKDIYHFDRCKAYFSKEDYQSALADCSMAIQLSPGHEIYYQMRGAIHLTLGEYRLALEDFEEVLRLNPNNKRVAAGKLQAERELESVDVSEIQSRFGFSFSPIASGTNQAGLQVTSVAAGSAAEQQGVRSGDTIVEINSVQVGSIKEMRSAIDEARAKGKGRVLIRYQRNGQLGFAALPISQNGK